MKNNRIWAFMWKSGKLDNFFASKETVEINYRVEIKNNYGKVVSFKLEE